MQKLHCSKIKHRKNMYSHLKTKLAIKYYTLKKMATYDKKVVIKQEESSGHWLVV